MTKKILISSTFLGISLLLIGCTQTGKKVNPDGAGATKQIISNQSSTTTTIK